MVTANFYLKDPEAKEETLIYLFLSCDGRRIKISVAQTIHPSDWNPSEQLARKTFLGHKGLNHSLKSLARKAEAAYWEAKGQDKVLSREQLLEALELNEAVSSSDPDYLIPFVEEHIKQSAATKTYGTIRSYKTSLSVLKRYSEARRRTIRFEDINLDFYNDFTLYMTRTLNYSANTIGKHVKALKVFMNEATDRGLNKNLDYRSRRFKVVQEDVESIYLTEEELKKIYELDLSEKPGLEIVRDLFLVGCYTGLRFSDFSQIEQENVRGDLLYIRTRKTGETVVIPIHPIIKDIMKRYQRSTGNMLPTSYSNQKSNEYLKEIGKLVGLKDKVLVSRNKGGVRLTERFHRYELISTHTARRSFATNLYLQGFPSISIMKITGHRSEKNFLAYIKITPEENAEKLKAFWKKVG